jgi:hypothetical protein
MSGFGHAPDVRKWRTCEGTFLAPPHPNSVGLKGPSLAPATAVSRPFGLFD